MYKTSCPGALPLLDSFKFVLCRLSQAEELSRTCKTKDSQLGGKFLLTMTRLNFNRKNKKNQAKNGVVTVISQSANDLLFIQAHLHQ